jgi:hypothetical protein
MMISTIIMAFVLTHVHFMFSPHLSHGFCHCDMTADQ